ncbi:MAG: acyl-CoA reductase [Bacteroidota bacterium]
MTLQERIALLVKLGEYLLSNDEYLKAVMHRTQYNNAWLTVENCEKAVEAIGTHFLQEAALTNWTNKYHVRDNDLPKTVGIVMAGNIPLVGFHDFLSVFLAGHRAQIKLSEKDKYLLPQLLKKLQEWDNRAMDYFKVVERLADFDAVIATGSNNSARYFEQYFGKYPHIIRRNRHAVAVLDGTESTEDLLALGQDVFAYYGLGCRNVSKLYLPKGYEFNPLLEALHEYNQVVLNNKYKNNFDYNYAMFLLNKVPYKANGCIILVENEDITSRIASLHYEFYDKADTLVTAINHRQSEIQCVVTKVNLNQLATVPFGKAQQPSLTDYADGVDTMQFLMGL